MNSSAARNIPNGNTKNLTLSFEGMTQAGTLIHDRPAVAPGDSSADSINFGQVYEVRDARSASKQKLVDRMVARPSGNTKGKGTVSNAATSAAGSRSHRTKVSIYMFPVKNLIDKNGPLRVRSTLEVMFGNEYISLVAAGDITDTRGVDTARNKKLAERVAIHVSWLKRVLIPNDAGVSPERFIRLDLDPVQVEDEALRSKVPESLFCKLVPEKNELIVC